MGISWKASKGRSEIGAVPGQKDGRDAVTQDETIPPRANGDMQILDTWSLTLTCPSSTTSISPRTTSMRSSRECCQVQVEESQNSAVFHPHHVEIVSNGAQVDHHSAPTSVWQDDVKAAVVNAWQMSSFRHILVGPSCLTEPADDGTGGIAYTLGVFSIVSLT